MDDDQLMYHISQGDKVAFHTIYKRHGGHLLGYARSFLKRTETAEEITQDIWCKVIRLAPSYKGSGNFVAWIYTLTRNACLNQLRSQSKLQFQEDAGAKEVSDADTEKEFLQKMDLSKLKEAILQLPDQQRISLLLFCVEDMSYDEIARELDLSLSSVKSLIFRARQTLGGLK